MKMFVIIFEKFKFSRGPGPETQRKGQGIFIDRFNGKNLSIRTGPKLGIVNLDIINKNGLKITPDNPNRIVCDNWTNLCPVESYYCENSKTGARMNVMNKIYKILFQNNNENI